MKKKAVDEPNLPPIQIMASADDVPRHFLAHMPNPLAMRRTIQRQRAFKFPANPRTIDDLAEIPAKYRITLDNNDFLIYDSFDFIDDEANGRIIMCSTDVNLRALSKSKAWYLDGTFKTSPLIFYQVFVIMGTVVQVIREKEQLVTLPFVYALLTSKEEVKV